jgi:hypothetical protein
MMKRITFALAIALTLILLTGAASAQSSNERSNREPRSPAGADDQQTEGEARITVARLTYDDESETICLSDAFLTTVARETNLPVNREMTRLAIGDDRLFDRPFVYMTGAAAFDLTSEQKKRLKTYLDRGGFLLASASCSNHRWAGSFRKLMKGLYPEKAFAPIEADHPLRHTLYDLEQIDTRQRTDVAALHGLTVGDRLAVVFSPVGVNGTDNAGGGCCCCGGNEVTSAKAVNANILLYALMH